MPTTPDTTAPIGLDVALAYHRAWSTGDFEHAMSFVADDVVCDSPGGRIEGADAFRGFMGPFAAMVDQVDLRAAFGDERTAVTMYDTRTPLVPDAPGAELATVRDGRIVYLRIVFDRLPFERARAAR